MTDFATPRVVDNDRDEITITLAGKEIRGWEYRDEAERKVKMLAAREFCEGWFQARERGSFMLLEALETIGALEEATATNMSDPAIRGWAYAAARVAQDAIEHAKGA